MSDRDQWLKLEGLDIRYRIYRAASAPKGRVLVLPGFTEFIEKHETTCARFNALGFDALVLDWPGQGRSTRLTDYSRHVIHSSGFDLHLDCLQAAAEAAGFVPDGGSPIFLFGHSMGGHLAMRYGAERMANCNGVIITAPMILPPLRPGWGVLMLVRIFCCAGFARYPALFQNRTPRDDVFVAGNALTRNPEGYAVQPQWWRRDERLQGCGASFGWVRDAYESCLATTANARWMKAFALPLSAHLAGDERVVSDTLTRKMLRRVAAAAIHDYPGARHELLLEWPDVVESLWRRVAAFIAAES